MEGLIGLSNESCAVAGVQLQDAGERTLNATVGIKRRRQAITCAACDHVGRWRGCEARLRKSALKPMSGRFWRSGASCAIRGMRPKRA